MHVDDGDPMIASSISCGFDSRDIRQFDKSIGRDPGPETPLFRVAGLEIRELLTTDRVDKKIAGLAIQSFCSTRKSATELLQLGDVHERTARGLTFERASLAAT